MYYEPLRVRKRERSGKAHSLLNDHPFNDALGERISSWLYSQALVIAGEVTTRELFPRLQLTSCPVVASGRLSGISSVTGGQEISAATAIFQTFAIEREKERICTWQLNYDRSNDSRSVSSLLRVIRQCSSLSALIIGAIHSDNSQYILCKTIYLRCKIDPGSFCRTSPKYFETYKIVCPSKYEARTSPSGLKIWSFGITRDRSVRSERFTCMFKHHLEPYRPVWDIQSRHRCESRNELCIWLFLSWGGKRRREGIYSNIFLTVPRKSSKGGRKRDIDR